MFNLSAPELFIIFTYLAFGIFVIWMIVLSPNSLCKLLIGSHNEINKSSITEVDPVKKNPKPDYEILDKDYLNRKISTPIILRYVIRNGDRSIHVSVSRGSIIDIEPYSAGMIGKSFDDAVAHFKRRSSKVRVTELT